MSGTMTVEAIRAARADKPALRARDLAESLGISEAELVAAHVGRGVTRISADPDRLVAGLAPLGDVLALTRNEHCVHERRGSYLDYRGGRQASMVLGAEIDLRIFPAHWVHGFAVVETGEGGVKRSLQVFDAAGDAVHKVHLKPESDVAAFDRLVADLRAPDQNPDLAVAARAAAEPAKGDPARAGELRDAWTRMTDTHQFLTMVRRLGMNRLGAYRMVGESHARPLSRESVTALLHGAAAGAVPIMIFVGNRGCIQIHSGPVEKVVPMGPWINVMDPRFNLHLRADRVAEVFSVTKPTRTGPAVSVEAFDAAGELILQVFGWRKDGAPLAWEALAAGLPRLEEVPA